MHDLKITIHGQQKSGKTAMAQFLSTVLNSIGIEVAFASAGEKEEVQARDAAGVLFDQLQGASVFLETIETERPAIAKEPPFAQLDEDVRSLVWLLWREGIHTCWSCGGGEGHRMPSPTVQIFCDEYEMDEIANQVIDAMGKAKITNYSMANKINMIDGELDNFAILVEIWRPSDLYRLNELFFAEYPQFKPNASNLSGSQTNENVTPLLDAALNLEQGDLPSSDAYGIVGVRS